MGACASVSTRAKVYAADEVDPTLSTRGKGASLNAGAAPGSSPKGLGNTSEEDPGVVDFGASARDGIQRLIQTVNALSSHTDVEQASAQTELEGERRKEVLEVLARKLTKKRPVLELAEPAGRGDPDSSRYVVLRMLL